MAPKPHGKAIARLAKEVKMVEENSPPGVIDIFYNDADMHNLFFAIAGPEDTSFAGGVYMLKIQLPKDYPYSPPDFIMLTPNGRFREGAKICTSFSSFHPETWSPAYTLTTLLLSFISFFTDEESPAQGMVHMSVAQRKTLAVQSVAWGAKSQHSKNLKIFQHLRPGLQTKESVEAAVSKLRGVHAAPTVPDSLANKRMRKSTVDANAPHDPAAPRQRRSSTVDLSGCVPSIVYNATASDEATGPVDLTGPPQHGAPGAIKRARAALRAQAGTLAGKGEASKPQQVSTPDVVDLT